MDEEEKVDEEEEEEEEEEMVAVVVVLVFMALRLRISDSQARVYIQRVLLTITGPVTWRPLNDYHGRLQQYCTRFCATSSCKSNS